jgi:hypothetical protein
LPKLEIKPDATWIDVTDDVRTGDGWSAKRGSDGEDGAMSPALLSITMDNTSGDYAARNPLGTYYGLLGRNTPCRASLPLGQSRLVISEGLTDWMTTPDRSGLDITGDIDLRADVTLPSWSDQPVVVVEKWATGQHSYSMWIEQPGHIAISWNDGTTDRQAISTVSVHEPATGRKSIRVTLDVNNGAGGKTARFYSSDDTNLTTATWVLLDTITTTSTTAINASTAALTVGAVPIVAGQQAYIHSVQVRNGIGGTLVASLDCTTATTDATTVADGVSGTWTAAGGAKVTRSRWLGSGELAKLPVKWDLSAADQRAAVESAGITRRLSTGQKPLQSVLRRALGALGTDCFHYWPMEEGSEATRLRPVLGATYGSISSEPGLAGWSDMKGSAPVVKLGSGKIKATVSDPETGVFQIRWIGSIPSTTPVDHAVMKLSCTGTMKTIQVRRDSYVGYITVRGDIPAVSPGPAGIEFTFGSLPDSIPLARFSLRLTQSGANISVRFGYKVPGAAAVEVTETWYATDWGKVTKVEFNPDVVSMSDVGVGHVTIESTASDLDLVLTDVLTGHAGETALDRIIRICAESSIPFRSYGDPASSQLVGPQAVATAMEIIQAAADADGGLLIEAPDDLVLGFRPLRDCLQARSTVTLAYDGGILTDPFEPIDDDARTRNDVEVVREFGSSDSAVLTSGTLSTAQPPAGVGIYDTSTTLGLYADEQCEPIAYWLLAQGTIDAPRFPQLTFNLSTAQATADPATVGKLLDLVPGDLVEITDIPANVGATRILAWVRGLTVTTDGSEVMLKVSVLPGDRAFTARYDFSDGRYGGVAAVLASSATSSATSLSVTVGTALWSHADGDFDILVGGEQMTCTNVTGSSSPQTFTVTRHVNGITKAHSAGAAVELYDRRVYAITTGSTTMVNAQPGRFITSTDIPDTMAARVTADSTIGSAATDFTATTAAAIVDATGKDIYLKLYINTTNALTAATGNITDITIFTLDAAYRPDHTVGFGWGSGLVTGEGVINTDGTVVLRSVSDTVSAGANLRINVGFKNL